MEDVFSAPKPRIRLYGILPAWETDICRSAFRILRICAGAVLFTWTRRLLLAKLCAKESRFFKQDNRN